MKHSKQKAFTLMELLVVIAVIGLLSSIIFAITRGANEQGRIAKGLQFSQHLHNSLGSYAAGIWSFDEGTGTAASDISGWGNNGTLVSSPTWRCAATDSGYTPSGQGCSLEFNGVDNYVLIGKPASLNDLEQFTYEAWVYWRGFGNYAWPRVFNKNYKFFNIYNDERIEATVYSDISPYARSISSGTMPQNTWTHLVMVYDDYGDRKTHIFMNGTEMNYSQQGTNTGVLLSDASYNLTISDGSSINAIIDEARVYATALTAAQIESQYYAGLENLLAKGRITEQEYSQRAAS
jgi:prepilin-type N-terminal cleavage/methylation domain-containing protein